MEPRSRVYTYSLRAPATLLGGAAGTTLLCPCKGAKYIIFHFKSTDATDTLSAVGFNAGNAAALLLAGNGSIISPTMVFVGAPLSQRLDQTDGLVAMVVPAASNPNMRLAWNYAQATFTAAGTTPTNDISGFEVTAEVFYDDDADTLYGQTKTAV